MGTTPTILIVEDDHSLSSVLSDTFTNNACKTLTAFSGKEGLSQVQSGKPDIILLDILMPDMTGIEMLKVLKDSPDSSHIPVIMLTNYNDPEKAAEARAHGAIDYLVKADNSLEKILTKVQGIIKSISLSD